MDNQSKNEIFIFKKFAKLKLYPICIRSIEKRNIPEPDILCKIQNRTSLAFELGESLDESYVGSLNDSFKLKDVISDQYNKLPKEEKEVITRNFSNSYISIFYNDASKSQKIKILPKFFNYLLKLNHSSKGEFFLNPSFNPKNIIEKIDIRRTNMSGPIFDVRSVGCHGDYTTELIRKKFQKPYTSKYNIELLVYYDSRPEIPENYWLDKVKRYIQDNIKMSIFKHIWLYSIRQNKILFVYPSIISDFE